MPDMCYIEMVIEKEGESAVTPEEKVVIEQRLLDKFGRVDYGKVVPEPMNVINWNIGCDTIKYASLYYDHNPDNLEHWEFYLLFHYQDENRPVEIKRGDVIINKKRVEQYGEAHKDETPNLLTNNFFDWCLPNWDTKWNGDNVEFHGNSFKFSNPYGLPAENIMKYITRTLCDVTGAKSLSIYADVESCDCEATFGYNREEDKIIDFAMKKRKMNS